MARRSQEPLAYVNVTSKGRCNGACLVPTGRATQGQALSIKMHAPLSQGDFRPGRCPAPGMRLLSKDKNSRCWSLLGDMSPYCQAAPSCSTSPPSLSGSSLKSLQGSLSLLELPEEKADTLPPLPWTYLLPR